MTRFGWSALLGLCAAVLALGLWLAGVFSGPAPDSAPPAPAAEVAVPLPTSDGKDELIWFCTGTDPQTDARAAMAAFEAGLAEISGRTAAAMETAMQAANAASEVPADLPEIEAAGEAEARALAADMQPSFGCRIESF